MCILATLIGTKAGYDGANVVAVHVIFRVFYALCFGVWDFHNWHVHLPKLVDVCADDVFLMIYP